jgi:hypothetical protein
MSSSGTVLHPLFSSTGDICLFHKQLYNLRKEEQEYAKWGSL